MKSPGTGGGPITAAGLPGDGTRADGAVDSMAWAVEVDSEEAVDAPEVAEPAAAGKLT